MCLTVRFQILKINKMKQFDYSVYSITVSGENYINNTHDMQKKLELELKVYF